jgi:hypothetical protein
MSSGQVPPDPPPEAYERVTNPERFGPLHERADRLIDSLEAEYDVIREEATDVDEELSRFTLVKPCVCLRPRRRDEAPLVFGWTSFPGLVVRLGRRDVNVYPVCGCDGCNESAEDQGELLEEDVAEFVSSTYTVIVKVRRVGKSWVRQQLVSPSGASGSEGLVTRAEARAIIGDGPAMASWKPWSRRAE